MNSVEVRKYSSVERRMVDSRVRFISPSQVEGRSGDTNAGKCGQRPLIVLKFVFPVYTALPEPCPQSAPFRKKQEIHALTRALLGLWIFHRLLGGGGGGVWTPPWSRLLVAVEKNERQRSKAREKSFRNHYGHFLAQVKIEVTRGQNSKIFQNGFSTIKSLILKVEQRIWHHRVCLVKARRTIYKMTLKGQGQSLTSGQVRPRSCDDRNGSYCISLDSPGQDERSDTNPTSLSLFD